MTEAPWKCPDCGTVAPSSAPRRCDGCGHVKFGDLTLTSEETDKSLVFGIGTVVSKYLLAGVESADVRYASSAQFKVLRDETAVVWKVQHDPSATNPTFLNGGALESPSTLKSGDILSIGIERLKLRVKVEG